MSNGELLDIAESEGYELLITTDQNIRHQQNLAGRRLAVIVLLRTLGRGSKRFEPPRLWSLAVRSVEDRRDSSRRG